MITAVVDTNILAAGFVRSNKVLDLGSYQGVTVLTARAFLNLLAAEGEGAE